MPNTTPVAQTESLYKGFAVIIDDKIGSPDEETDKIGIIANKIKERGIPSSKFTEIPEDKFIDNFLSVNFIILDWLLMPLDMKEEDVTLPLKRTIEAKNIIFLKKIKETVLCPVFIFTKNEPDEIITKLKSEGLYFDETEKNFIFVTKKENLVENEHLFNSIEDWIKNNPAIYTLKKWEVEFYKAKNATFVHLSNISSAWPKILWDTFNFDRVNESMNINDILFKNIKSRTSAIHFDETIISRGGALNIEHVKSVIIGANFLPASNLPENDVQPGDIFKDRDDYYINIRPICDTVIGRTGCDGKIYCLKGAKLGAGQAGLRYSPDLKMIIDRHDEVIIFGVGGKNFISFKLKEIVQLNYDDYKAKKIERLLQPHSSHVQQIASSYMGRHGLPRIPEEVYTSSITLPTA